MKYGWTLPLLLLCGLLLAPNAAFAAASDAAMLWWTRVLPSLLPYLIASALLERSGLMLRMPKRLAPLFLFLFGALGGYPVGARLLERLRRDGAITGTEAGRAAAFCNLPNPVFLISVAACGVFQSIRTAGPLLIGVYGAALFGLIPLFRIRFAETPRAYCGLSGGDLPDAIETGVHAVLIIGGCMVFASVLGALTGAFCTAVLHLSVTDMPASAVYAGLLGLFEMTCGVRAFAALSLSLRFRLAVCAALIAFGGVSVLLQTASQLRISMPRYVLFKLLFAVCAFALTYWITPLFCQEPLSAVFADRAEMGRNAAAFAAVAVSAGVGLLSVFVLTCGLRRKNRSP